MLVLPIHNLNLVDFSDIFKSQMETSILNDLESYGLIKGDAVNIKNKDVRKILYHHIIHDLCEHILSVKEDEKVVIIYSTITSPTNHLHNYIDESDLMNFLNKFIARITGMLPIRILQIDTGFDNVEEIMNFQTGECYEIINNAKSLLESFDISSFTFSKARYFAKKYELEYLSNNYFTKIKNKQLILS